MAIVPTLLVALLTNGGLAAAPQNPTPQAARRSSVMEQSKPVKGYLLVTDDAKAADKAERTVPYGAPRKEFEKAFPATRYRIVPWGEDRLLVIDLTTGPLGRLHDEGLVTRAFLDKRESDGPVMLARLAPEEIESMRAVYNGTWPGAPDQPHDAPASVSLSLNPKVELTVGGQTKTMRLQPTQVESESMIKAARARFGPPGAASKGDVGERVRRDRTSLCFEAVPNGAMPEGMELFAKTMASLQKEIVDANRAATENLMKALGYKVPKDAEASKSATEMPYDLRQRLEDSLAGSWQVAGFASRAEAEAFLAASDSYRVSTEVSLDDVTDPGDGAFHPATIVSYRLTTVPGYYP